MTDSRAPSPLAPSPLSSPILEVHGISGMSMHRAEVKVVSLVNARVRDAPDVSMSAVREAIKARRTEEMFVFLPS